jgi:hypothetical protein
VSVSIAGRKSVGALGFLLLVAAAVVPLLVQTAAAASFSPTRFDDPDPDGCGATDCSLREAVLDAEASAGADTIIVPAGIYTLTRATPSGATDDGTTGDLDINSALTITGEGSKRTVIDANDIDRVFDLTENANAYIARMSVQNGSGQTSGVGVGAAHQHGGAIHNHGTVTLVDMAIIGSTVPSGWGGGGFTNAPAATALLQNVTVTANTTAASGGGIENNSSAQLFNVTVARNTAGQGGGIFTGGTATTRVNNTIVARNSGGDCSGAALTSVDHNLATDATCSLSGQHDLVTLQTRFETRVNATGLVFLFGLRRSSAAIDAGSGPYDATTNIGCATTDQRGVLRPKDGDRNGSKICDIGSFERRKSGF